MKFTRLIRVLVRWATAALVVFAVASPAAMAADDPSLTRTLTDGPIKGKAAANDTQAFLGIPFAKPPVGDLRWRAPQPPDTWSKALDVTQFASMCAQIGGLFGEPDPDTFGKLVGSEDCLYLNVWRPNSNADKLPVFFWIHGGGNVMGSARESIYDGAYLAHKANMVVVTVQYRLGMLGSLRHPALAVGRPKSNKDTSYTKLDKLKDESGNFATLDLLRALDWVQANADAFGGDPGLVTVAGQSAGCMNTWGLLQSPLAKDKFHRALCMSNMASASSPDQGQKDADKLIGRLLVDTGRASNLPVAELGRNFLTQESIFELLHTASAEQIMKLTVGQDLTQDLIMPGQYTDGTVIRSGGLLGIALGDYNKVPLMIGSTGDDSTLMTFLLDPFKLTTQPTHKELWRLINEDPGSVRFDQLVKPESQGRYAIGNWLATKLLIKSIDDQIRVLSLNNNDIYRYQYNWKDIPQSWKSTFGAFHNIDLAALFGNFVTDKDKPNFMRFAWTADNADSRKALSDKFIGYVANFARYGKPLVDDKLNLWGPWTNLDCAWALVCPKRMIFDNSSRMSDK